MAKNSDGTAAAPPAIDSMDFRALANGLLRDILARWALPRAAVPRPCAHCGIMLDPAFPGDAYCSQRCLDAHRAAHAATIPTTDDDPTRNSPGDRANRTIPGIL